MQNVKAKHQRRVVVLTNAGLHHIVNLGDLESLQIYCSEAETFDSAFLAELAGDNSPLFLELNSYKELSDADLVHISQWNRLTACSLSLNADVRDDFPWLAGLKDLRCLQLNGDAPLTQGGLARLSELSELRELELDLVLHDSAGLGLLTKLKNLESLSICVKCGENANGHILCSELAQSGSIRNLEVRVPHTDTAFFDISINDLANLAAMPQLEKLNFSGQCGETLDFAVLSDAPHLKEVYHPGIASPTDRDLAGLAEITGLTWLEVWVENCTSKGLAALATLSHLTELKLCGFHKQDESFLACLADFPVLAKLTLSFNGNYNLGLRSFSFLKNIANLTSLTIDERGEWNEGMIDDIVAAKGLKSLCFDSLWDFPGIWLKKLKRLPRLEEIKLDHCLSFWDQDLALLAETKTLRRIHLQYCDPITIKGLLSLRHLPLEEITVHSLRHLSRVSEQELMALRLAWPEAIIS